MVRPSVTYNFETGDVQNRCLGIVVPYRDRKNHLDKFIPHLSDWFARHKSKAPNRIVLKIIEQDEGLVFNRGKLKNVGYELLKETVDYVCFHDVDYLPIRADYTAPETGWVHLVSRGAEAVADPRGFNINHDERFTGGVVLFSKAAFEKINGYSNSYWGWGFEDTDLQMRCRLCEIQFARRNGKFRLLSHLNEGFELQDSEVRPTFFHLQNLQLLEKRFPRLPVLSRESHLQSSAMHEDGLSSLKFSITSRSSIPVPNSSLDVEKITVSI